MAKFPTSIAGLQNALKDEGWKHLVGDMDTEQCCPLIALGWTKDGIECHVANLRVPPADIREAIKVALIRIVAALKKL